MCFIVARCPGRSVLKAVRRLKPEKPTKRLLTRRWRTIRISKGQLSLSYLTLPAKEIRLGPTILRSSPFLHLHITRRLSRNLFSPPCKEYLTRSKHRFPLEKVIKIDIPRIPNPSRHFFLSSFENRRKKSTMFSFQISICFVFFFLPFFLLVSLCLGRLGLGIFRRDWLHRQWRQGARSESKGNRP